MQKIAHDVIGLQAAIQKEAGIGDVASTLWNGAKGYVTGKANDIGQGLANVGNGVWNAAKGFGNNVSGLAKTVGNIPVEAAKGMWRGGAGEAARAAGAAAAEGQAQARKGLSQMGQGAQQAAQGLGQAASGAAGLHPAVVSYGATAQAKNDYNVAQDKAKGLGASPQTTPTDMSAFDSPTGVNYNTTDLQGMLAQAYNQAPAAPQQQAQPEQAAQQPAVQPAPQQPAQPEPQQQPAAQPSPQQQPAAPQFDPSKITRQQMQQYARQTGARNMNSEMDRWKTWQAMQGNRNASNADYKAWKQQQAQPVKSANFNSVLTRWLGMA